MSYMSVLQVLETGDVVTFNDSGNANANESPQLFVAKQSNDAIQRFWDANGILFQLIEREGELVLQEDRDHQDETRPPDWKDYAVVETVELIGE